MAVATSAVPGPDETTGSTQTPPTAAGNTVYGRIAVRFAKMDSKAVLPANPSYSILIQKVGDEAGVRHDLAANGDFGADLPQGTYDVEVILIRAPELGTEEVRVPLTNVDKLRFTVPPTGCVYVGTASILYGRLPAGSLKAQTAIVEKLSMTNGQNYSFVHLPEGGITITGGNLSMPAAAQRPADAMACKAEGFTSVPS